MRFASWVCIDDKPPESVQCHDVSMDQNLWVMFLTPHWIHAAKVGFCGGKMRFNQVVSSVLKKIKSKRVGMLNGYQQQQKKNQNLVSKNKKNIIMWIFSKQYIYIYCLYIIWQSLHRFLLNTGSRNLSLNISQFELNNATDKDSCSFFFNQSSI